MTPRLRLVDDLGRDDLRVLVVDLDVTGVLFTTLSNGWVVSMVNVLKVLSLIPLNAIESIALLPVESAEKRLSSHTVEIPDDSVGAALGANVGTGVGVVLCCGVISDRLNVNVNELLLFEMSVPNCGSRQAEGW